MAPRIPQFRPVQGPDYAATANIVGQAGRSIDKGFSAFSDVLGGLKQRNVAEDTRITQGNDRTIKADLERFGSLGELNQADKAGQLTDTAIQSKFGTQYDSAAFNSNLKAIKARLRGKAVNEASATAYQEAESTGDITQAQSAMHKSLIDAGMTTPQALAATTKFGNDAGVIKDRIKKKETDLYNSVMQGLDEALTTGTSTTSENLNAARNQLPAKLRAKLDREGKKLIADRSQMNQDQKNQYDYLSQTNKDAIGAAQRQGELGIQSLQAELSNIPQAISNEVAGEFENVTDPGSHVLEKFQAAIVDPASAGIVNAILSPFSPVATGDKAMEIVNDKYQNLIASGTLSDADTAAVLWESWKATLQSHQTPGAPGVDPEAFDKEIARRTQAMVARKQKQSDINAARLKHESNIQGMQRQSRDQLFNFSTDTRKANRTGVAIKQPSALNTPKAPGVTQKKSFADRADELLKENQEKNTGPSSLDKFEATLRERGTFAKPPEKDRKSTILTAAAGKVKPPWATDKEWSDAKKELKGSGSSALSNILRDVRSDNPEQRLREMIKENPNNTRLKTRLKQMLRSKQGQPPEVKGELSLAELLET